MSDVDHSLAVTIRAEERLDGLAKSLDTSRRFEPGSDQWPFMAIVLGHRARTFFLAVRRAKTDAEAQVLTRPLAELVVLIEWLAHDPETRVPLWVAESLRMDLVYIQAVSTKTQFAARMKPVVDQTAEKQGIVDRQRRGAIDAGLTWVGERGPLIPSLDHMASSVNSETSREAYNIAFRATSPWTHVSAGTFAEGLRGDPDGITTNFVGDSSTQWIPGLRALAATSFSIILRRVSRVANLGIEADCANVQASLTGRSTSELMADTD